MTVDPSKEGATPVSPEEAAEPGTLGARLALK